MPRISSCMWGVRTLLPMKSIMFMMLMTFLIDFTNWITKVVVYISEGGSVYKVLKGGVFVEEMNVYVHVLFGQHHQIQLLCLEMKIGYGTGIFIHVLGYGCHSSSCYRHHWIHWKHIFYLHLHIPLIHTINAKYSFNIMI